MHNVKTIIREDYKNKDGESAIVLQVYIKGKRVVLPTGILVPVEMWDDDKKCVRAKHEKAGDYNLIIEKARALVNDIQVKYRLSGRQLTGDQLRVEYKNPSMYLNFCDWMRAEINHRKGMISASTIVMHHSILNCLEKFRKEILFSEIDVKFLEQFEKFLKVKKKNRVDTISKKMRVLRLYLNRAKRHHIIKANPFDEYKIKKGKGRIVYLDETELRKLFDLFGRELAPRNMKKVLRYFLFSCVTGLRLGDVKRLKRENIINDIIVLVPQKKLNTDHETVNIPLCRTAMQLLNSSECNTVKGRIFDCYCDQVTNRYLKDIAKLQKIEKLITFHTARHTFATLFLEKTNDLASLQKLLGHASIVQTMVYAHVSDKRRRDQIMVFDKIVSF